MVGKKQRANTLDVWIFVGLMYAHIPVLRAALHYYIKAGKVPPHLAQSVGVLAYILEGTLEKLTEPLIEEDDDDRR